MYTCRFPRWQLTMTRTTMSASTPNGALLVLFHHTWDLLYSDLRRKIGIISSRIDHISFYNIVANATSVVVTVVTAPPTPER